MPKARAKYNIHLFAASFGTHSVHVTFSCVLAVGNASEHSDPLRLSHCDCSANRKLRLACSTSNPRTRSRIYKVLGEQQGRKKRKKKRKGMVKEMGKRKTNFIPVHTIKWGHAKDDTNQRQETEEYREVSLRVLPPSRGGMGGRGGKCEKEKAKFYVDVCLRNMKGKSANKMPTVRVLMAKGAADCVKGL